MPRSTTSTRTALLAGATGLIGRALLTQLVERSAYRHVTVLVRRAAADLASADKVDVHTIDFAKLPSPFPEVDDVYIALGTTIKTAGSQKAFRRVDYDHVVAVASAAREAGAQRLAVVSALGANRSSFVFYNRVKGEMEEAVNELGYTSVVIAQPSLLVGDRAALGQPVRSAETLVAGMLQPVMGWVPKAVRPIAAADVASAMVDATLAGTPGRSVLGSAQMQHARRA